MQKNTTALHGNSEQMHGSIKSYVVGFILSIVLTLGAYFLVAGKVFSGWTLDIIITLLSIVQICVQLLFFLHLSEEGKPRWNLLTFLFMLLVLGILVLGTIWIMYNLDYRMMPDMTTMKMPPEGI